MFAIGATLLTGVLCSLAPAFAALHTIPMHSLKEGGRTETAPPVNGGFVPDLSSPRLRLPWCC